LLASSQCPATITLKDDAFYFDLYNVCQEHYYQVHKLKCTSKLDNTENLSTKFYSVTCGINNKLIHSTRSKGCANSVNNCLASIYVADQLWLAL